MGIKFPFDENTRVTILTTAPSILYAPTTAELNAGTDITCDLTADGLKLGKANNSISSGGLCSDVDSTVPGRTTFSASLTGFKYKQPADTPLWRMAAHKGGEAWIAVRYGYPHDQAWANGDDVEIARFQWGERATADTSNDTLATFTLPIHIQEFEDAAFVGGIS
jgi:hypothetical protein